MGADSPFPVPGEQAALRQSPPRPSYAQRIQRARALSGRYPAATEVLHYYTRLAFSQQHIFDSLDKSAARLEVANLWPLQLEPLLPLFPDFARALAEISPAPMRVRASSLAGFSAAAQQELLASFWNSSLEDSVATSADRFIALAFLQPYAEWLAQSGFGILSPGQHATCPVCGSEPVCAVLRDQDHGARRSLLCSLCMNEWNFPRLACPACGEHRFESLPVFTPEESPHIRVDACDTCHRYLKTIDMTKDGLAIPIVDELAAVSLDLWAGENGYCKLVPNLAGI